MFIIKYKKIFFALGLILIGASIGIMIVRGFKFGIDFTGGSVIEIEYQSERPDTELIQEKITLFASDILVQETGEKGVIIRTEPIDQTTKDAIVNSLSFEEYSAFEKRFNTVGPSVGSQLRSKAIISIIIVSLATILFIAFAFRKVSKPVSSWVYGGVAVLALIHDVVIPAGIFSWLGIQIDILFVVGILTILGVSINDTIVVFDRIRENLKVNETKHIHEPFAETVGKSITQTLTRSVMTSVLVLLALLALWIWGPESTHNLAMIMFLGMFFGTYSSIFLAAPLLVVWNEWRSKKS